MAFALTSFVADGTRFMGPGPLRSNEVYVFTITGLVTDVALDIGNVSGTFWTAALADATYGDLATSVLAFIQNQVSNYSGIEAIFMSELYARIQVPSGPSGTQYIADINASTLLPDYTFAASNGGTAYTLTVQYLLKPNLLPTVAAYNVIGN